ncbi:hypothetical protein EJ02DRAFT_446884 [Clathrospora elynae]|uniref:Chromatin modification-related protein n=1 Tax=Clathrospora elynae TaxID=706981 RepID=A0A6A5SFE4_9PLEO|nr:hypothetical protein EJ02DRAFT_446884 [Clathrospora elynae]
MSDADDAPAMAQAAPNPDAQTTVNDFLDYTEFFPSDLVRSLTLIADLDATYSDAVQQVHELTVLYGTLPTLAGHERPDPALLRKQISQHLQKAINQREFAYTEASRLYEVTVRHCQRSSVIKRKLQAQPEPPSRDPTPPPVSPNAHRLLNRNYERTPHLRLTFDGGRHGANTARPRDRTRHKKTAVTLPRGRARARDSPDESDGESDIGSAIDVAVSHRKRKQDKDRASKASRSRAAGVLGTNVHSAIAGISTSNALAQLAPPPPDARPGSKWAPWKELTEYEMAVLRKQMKKNAVWTPSKTMMLRELEKKHRTEDEFEREKARCEATGEPFLNEAPETLQQIMTASGLGQLAPHGPQAANPPAYSEASEDDMREETGTVSIRLKPVATKEGRKLDRLSQRQQAMRDAEKLIGATERIKEAANGLKGLTFLSHAVASPASQKKKLAARPSNKRKRDASPPPATEGAAEATRETSVATQDSSTKPPEPKRARLQLIAPAPSAVSSPIPTPNSTVSTPRENPTSLALSPVAHTHVPLPESKPPTNEHILQIPLVPAGPSTPKVNRAASNEPSREPSPEPSREPSQEPSREPSRESSPAPTPAEASPTVPEKSKKSPIASTAPSSPSSPSPAPALAQPMAPAQLIATAASSRPRRESVATKAPTPPVAPAPALKTSKTPTPEPEPAPGTPAPTLRPRSARGHVPTPKAQSEEPKPNEEDRITRETRRHSVFSQSAAQAPTRTSSRRKPPPKGEVTAAEDGKKTVTNVKRAQGSKNNKKKKAEEEVEMVDDIDPDEPKYCICDDVSFGAMISCDNNCDKEWFHLPCMKMTQADIPSRRAKWYCPDCRASLGVDAYGNPPVPPPLPGRRGNR